MSITHETHQDYAPLVEYGGEIVARLRWSSNGVGVEFPTGVQVLASEDAKFTLVWPNVGQPVDVTFRELPGIIYGEWVTARKARFG